VRTHSACHPCLPVNGALVERRADNHVAHQRQYRASPYLWSSDVMTYTSDLYLRASGFPDDEALWFCL
jgi:hypothetical protein